MTNKPKLEIAKKPVGIDHPGMLGDGTEEQSLNERGDPALRIKKDEVDAALKKLTTKKKTLHLP